jgi:hypothetical protein
MKVLIIIFGFSFYNLYSQQPLTAVEAQTNLNSVALGNNVYRAIDNRYKGVHGTMTIFENYLPGKIVMSKGQIVVHDKVNYDAYNDELIVIKKDQEVALATLMVNNFSLYSPSCDTLDFVRLIDSKGKIGFFEMLFHGEQMSLVKKHKKILLEPSYKGAYSAGREYAEFINENKKFVLLSDNQPKEFKNRKTLIEILPDKKDQIEKYCKQNKVDFKKEDDLLYLFVNLNKS